jgi:hypothetical protein
MRLIRKFSILMINMVGYGLFIKNGCFWVVSTFCTFGTAVGRGNFWTCLNKEKADLDSSSCMTYDLLGFPPSIVHSDLWAPNIIFEKDKNGNPTSNLLAIIDWQDAHPGVSHNFSSKLKK